MKKAVATLHGTFFMTMSPKTELILGIFLLVLVPLGIWAIISDVQSGETTFTGIWTPPWRPVNRQQDASGFWRRIFQFAFGGVVAFVVGIIYLYNAWRHWG